MAKAVLLVAMLFLVYHFGYMLGGIGPGYAAYRADVKRYLYRLKVEQSLRESGDLCVTSDNKDSHIIEGHKPRTWQYGSASGFECATKDDLPYSWLSNGRLRSLDGR